MKKLCLSLVLASIGSLALTNSAIADEVNEIYNPNPQKDDVVLSMPCDGIMVFRKVYTSNDPKKIKDKNITQVLHKTSLLWGRIPIRDMYKALFMTKMAITF